MSRPQEMSQLQEISQTMLALAKANNWEQLPELEIKRKSLMQSFFERQPVSTRNSVEIEQVIKNILSINDKIAHLAEQEKITIGQKLHGMKKRQNVHSAYVQNK